MTETRFSRQMQRRSDKDLLSVLDDQGIYEEEALYAAARELQSRGVNVDDKIPEEKLKSFEDKFISEQQEKKEKDKFISKNFIYRLAFIFTPVIIGPFVASNVWVAGKKREAWLIVLLSVIYLMIVSLISYFLRHKEAFRLVILGFHLIYTFGLIELVWRKYLPESNESKKA